MSTPMTVRAIVALLQQLPQDATLDAGEATSGREKHSMTLNLGEKGAEGQLFVNFYGPKVAPKEEAPKAKAAKPGQFSLGQPVERAGATATAAIPSAAPARPAPPPASPVMVAPQEEAVAKRARKAKAAPAVAVAESPATLTPSAPAAPAGLPPEVVALMDAQRKQGELLASIAAQLLGK